MNFYPKLLAYFEHFLDVLILGHEDRISVKTLKVVKLLLKR